MRVYRPCTVYVVLRPEGRELRGCLQGAGSALELNSDVAMHAYALLPALAIDLYIRIDVVWFIN
jgi:hypothetical protein